MTPARTFSVAEKFHPQKECFFGTNVLFCAGYVGISRSDSLCGRFCAGIGVSFTRGFFMRVILRGKWGIFSARIAAAVDSERVLVLFSARILFVAGLERDFKCFSARIASAVDSARDLGHFPARIVVAGDSARDLEHFSACRQEMSPPPQKKGQKKSQPHF